MGRHGGEDDRAQIYVDYIDYGTPCGAAPDDRGQIYVDYIDYDVNSQKKW